MKIGIYFAAVLVVGAALAPGLFNLGRAVAGFRIVSPGGDGPGAYLHRVLTGSDFKRYFNRAMMLAALVCLIPLLRTLRVRRVDLALERNPRRLSHFGIGFAAAGLFLLAMGGVYVAMKLFAVEVTLTPAILTRVVASALAVGIIEEFFFRGAMLGIVLRTARPFGALLFVSAFYALVHFLKPPNKLVVVDSDVGWGTGFWMIGQILGRFGNPAVVAAEFATLFAVGWVLGLARLRTGSLWLSIGLHAGWIFSLKFYTEFTRLTPRLRRGDYLPWVGTDLKVGVVPLVVVVLTGLVVFLCIRKRADDARAVSSGA